MSERRCPECDTIQKRDGLFQHADSCLNCGVKFEKKYPALRTLAGIYEILAGFVGMGAVLFYLVDSFSFKEWGISTIIYFLIAGFIVISILAYSEIIKLFVNIANDVRVIKESSNKSAA